MPDYKTMYLSMFNAVTDMDRKLAAMAALLQEISLDLKIAQLACEERQIKAEETVPLKIL